MSLEGLQVEFIHALFEPNTPSASQTRSARHPVTRHIKPSSMLSAEQQFEVYRGSVVGGLSNALGDIYPRLKQLTGETFFNALAKKYIENHPPQSSSLDDYGEAMRAFCVSFQPLADLPYVPDLVAAEWAWHRAFHSKDCLALSASDLQSAVANGANMPQIQIHPSATLVCSTYPIFTIWQCLEDARAGRDPEAFDLVGTENIVIWREGLQVQVLKIDHATQLFIEALNTSSCLETAMQQCLMRAPNIDPKEFSQSLSTLLSRGLLRLADQSLVKGQDHDPSYE